MFKINQSRTPQIAAKKLSAALSKKLEAAKTKKLPALLLLSGGSSFTVLDFIEEKTLGKYLTISMIDERYDPTNENNNFSQLMKTEFYYKAAARGAKFISTAVKKNQTQKALAVSFEKQLKDWKNKNRAGLIMAIIGMGADGHIAGIMPETENQKRFQRLFFSSAWVTSYNTGKKNPYPRRITATATFLKLIDYSFAFICGQEKSANLCKITQPGHINELPARILKDLKNTTIYTDIQ